MQLFFSYFLNRGRIASKLAHTGVERVCLCKSLLGIKFFHKSLDNGHKIGGKYSEQDGYCGQYQ